MRLILMIVVGVVLAALLAWGPVANRKAHEKYVVGEKHGAIEIRTYPPAVMAEVDIRGSMKEAMGDGSDILSEYIAGKNASTRPLAVTAGGVATQTQANDTIPMTLPVMQMGNADATWKIRYVMPETYTLETLPKPANFLIRLVPLAQRRVVALRFSGSADEEAVKARTDEVQAFLKEQSLPPRSNPILAVYDPVWTVPFLRHNEVMVEIDPPALPARFNF